MLEISEQEKTRKDKRPMKKFLFAFCFLLFACSWFSVLDAKEDVLMPRGSGSSTFFPHLDNFKGIDTVVYDLSGTSLPQYISSPRFVPKDIAPAFDTVFLGYESLKVAPVYANFQQMSSSERYKNNILNISITVTNVKKKLLETNEIITLVSVSHRLWRGNEKTIIPAGNYAVAFIYNGDKEKYLNDVRNSIRTLIGHIPNYIICANESMPRKQCKGPNFRYYEMENVEIGDTAPELVEVNEQSFRSEKVQIDNDVNKTLEHKCAELSERSEYDYRVISGKVVKSGIGPTRPIDCFSSDLVCKRAMNETSFFAIVRPENSESNEVKNITIYTKFELQQALLNKPLYMNVDKTYDFCARVLSDDDYITYRIDNIHLIKELEIGE